MKKVLLFVLLCVCAVISVNAEITTTQITQNEVSGYAITGWQNSGELATYLSTATNDVKGAAFVRLGSGSEKLSQADINALSAFTNAQYLRMDGCVLDGTVDFSQMGEELSQLLEVTMPKGVTREQVVAANTRLKSVASGLKLVVGLTGETVGEVKTHYWYTIPNVGTFEYTDPVAEGQTSITVSNYAIMADLTPVSGYPKNFYINSKNGDKEYEVDDAYVSSHTKNVWGSDYFVPSPLDVKLTPTNVNFVTVNINGTTYSLPDNTAVTEDNGVYKLSNWTYCEKAGQGINAGTEVTVTPGISYYYKWRENNSEVDKKYTGDLPNPNDDGDYVVALENNYNGNDGYKFDVTTLYLYTYTDKNGYEATYNQYDEDGKIQIDTYSGTLNLTTTTEPVYSLVVDGATACVNVAGSLPDAARLFSDETLNAYKDAKRVTVLGTINSSDVNFSSFFNHNFGRVFDLSEANVSSVNWASDLKMPGHNSGQSKASLILPSTFVLTTFPSLADGGNQQELGNILKYADANTVEIVCGDASILPFNATNMNERHTLKFLYNDNYNSFVINAATTTAINEADASLTSVDFTAMNGHFTLDGDALTLDNDNLTAVNLAGVSLNVNNSVKNVDVSGCSSLTTLNLTGSTVGDVNAANTKLTTFTTNGETTVGALNLTNTKLTSFSTKALVKGDITLNATSTLTSIDLSGTQFEENSTTKIHIHATADENDEDPIAALNVEEAKTINVPTGFDKEKRIHPYAAVADNIDEKQPLGDVEDEDGCYLAINDETKVVTVHTPIAGHFKALFDKKFLKGGNTLDSNYEGYTFKFDSQSNINVADLKAIAGEISYNTNKFYVDLFDLPYSEALCGWDDPEKSDSEVGIIAQAIRWMRNTGETGEGAVTTRQFRGLILPKDHTVYGNGTTLIQGGNRGTVDDDLSTCSEFIAYYKTKDEKDNPITNQLFVAHVYNAVPNGSVTVYQDAYDKMMTLMAAHGEVATDADIYQISSNFQLRSSNGDYTKIDLTKQTTGLPSGKAIVETYNNEMVGAPTIANMFSDPVNPGDFASSATATGMMNTPTEKLTIVGPMKESDFEAIGTFAANCGPRVLDLRSVTLDPTEGKTFDQMLAKINNSSIQYVVLPENTNKDIIFADYKKTGNMTGLLAVINASPAPATTTDAQGNQKTVHTQPNIVANIYKAGSLYEARTHALDLAMGSDGQYHLYNGYGVESVTLKGNLNAADITAQVNSGSGCHLDADGHWSTTATSDIANRGLLGEAGVKSFDLEQAVFSPQEDMNFWKVGHEYLEVVKLPTSATMTTLSASCFENMQKLQSLCIPINYQYIKENVFHNCVTLQHIYTTPFEGLEENQNDHGDGTITLPPFLKEIESGAFSFVDANNPGITDVYVLSKDAPKCAPHAFSPMMTYGNNTYALSHPYSRDMYKADGHIMTVLHFPNELTEAQKKKYTDITRKYSLMDETGDSDADGNPMIWPTQAEFNRAMMQGNLGYLWDEWPARDATGELDNSGCSLANNDSFGNFWFTYDGRVSADAINGNKNEIGDYLGWHEFALCGSGYFYDVVTQDETEYYELDWYTLCIPYDLTPEMVAKAAGVQKVDGLTKTLHRKDGTTVEITNDFYPELRTFTAIQHDLTNGNITLTISTNLSKFGELKAFSVEENKGKTSELGSGAPLIKGGYPYIIRPVVPKSVYDELAGKFEGAGKYIMSKLVDKDDLKGNTEKFNLDGENQIDVFVPCEKHQIIAVGGGENLREKVGDEEKPYLYNFMGTYKDRTMPKYSYYIGKDKSSGAHKFFRSTSAKKKWNAYSAIIAPLGEAHYEVKTVDKSQTVVMVYSEEAHDDTRIINAPSRYQFVFADGGVEDLTGVEDEATSIETLDGELVSVPAGKIYNLGGQYVGSSLEGLSKGLYIVNGKKFVVK